MWIKTVLILRIKVLYLKGKTIYQKTVCARPRKATQGSIKKLSRISAQGVLRKAAQGVLHKLLPIVTLFSKALFTIMFTYFLPFHARPAQDLRKTCARSQVIMLATVLVLVRLSWWWQEAGDKRQETGDKRQETGDRRQETRDRRQETGDRRQEARDRRQETGDRKQQKL